MLSTPPPPAIRFPPPLVWIGFLLLGYIADQMLDLARFAFGMEKALAGVLVAGGATMIFLAVGSFHRVGERPEPWTGSESMIEAGLYRLSRNPMYLGMAAAALGVAFWFGSWAMLAAAALATWVIDRFVISREEAYLEARFGDEYRAYGRRVRRWI